MASRGERLKYVARVFDNYEKMSNEDKCKVLVEMCEYQELGNVTETELGKLKRTLIYERRYDLLQMLKNALNDIGVHFDYTKPTIYNNAQNVHAVESSTIEILKKIINKFGGGKYFRPCELKSHEYFFDMIETPIMDLGVDPRKAFAAVWKCITSNVRKEMIIHRLRDEITDSEGKCLSGCLGRLVNSIRGFGLDEYETKINDYEYERGKIYYVLNSKLVNTDPDAIAENIKMLIDRKHIKPSVLNGCRILNEYSGCNWIRNDNGEFFFHN